MPKKDEGRVLTPEEVAAVNDPILTAENEAVNRATALEGAEGSLDTVGRAFGEAMMALRKATKGKDWMVRLKRLGISYHKAYYWTNVVEGKSNNRHKRYEQDDFVQHKTGRSARSRSAASAPSKALDWAEAASRLGILVDAIAKLSAVEPAGKKTVCPTFERLAALLGYTLLTKQDASEVEDMLAAALIDAVHSEGTVTVN